MNKRADERSAKLVQSQSKILGEDQLEDERLLISKNSHDKDLDQQAKDTV